MERPRAASVDQAGGARADRLAPFRAALAEADRIDRDVGVVRERDHVAIAGEAIPERRGHLRGDFHARQNGNATQDCGS
jgi:hypothetical protein